MDYFIVSSICFVILAFFFLLSNLPPSRPLIYRSSGGGGFPFPFRPVSPLSFFFFFDFLGSGFGVNTFPRRERHFQTWRPFPKPFIFYPCKCGTSDTLVFLLSSRCTVARQRIEVHQSSHSRVNVAPVRIMKLFVATMTPPLSQIFYVSLFEHGFS